MTKNLARVLTLLMAAPLLLWAAASTSADGGTIRLISSSVTSEFPEGLRYKVNVSGENEITSIAVRFRIGQQTRGAFEYLEHDPGLEIESELFWRTNTGARYIPPGTIIYYNFEIEDSEGARLDTEPQEFIYHDARFQWKEVSAGSVTVAYHGPVQTRAQIVLDSIVETMGFMGPLLGADTVSPIRVTMYNNVKEMLGALPPGSTTIRRELITEGQAFTSVGTVMLLGGGRAANGTASHEVTHVLVHRAASGVFSNVPSWLNEGLAEFGNIAPGFSYDIALEFAVATDRLLPITTGQVIPGDPEKAIIFYGEASSIVSYMVTFFGAAKMKELMATMKSGRNVDDAVQQVYGVDRLGLENLWREWIGAPAYVPPPPGSTRPTPLPLPTVLPYSLTPQPSGVTVAGTEPTATPEPLQVESPTPEPTLTPTAEPEPTATPLSEPLAMAAGEPEPQEQAPGGGGACSGPGEGGPRAMDMSALALLAGLVGLGIRRRFAP